MVTLRSIFVLHPIKRSQTEANRVDRMWQWKKDHQNLSNIDEFSKLFFFSVYRFVWSQCGTNNRILNASDCLIRAQKQSYRQKVQLVHFSIPLSLYDSPAEEQKTGNKGEDFFIVIIFHICIQIFKIFSLTAESMCRAEKKSITSVSPNWIARGEYMHCVSIINIAVIIFYCFEWGHPAFYVTHKRIYTYYTGMEYFK